MTQRTTNSEGRSVEEMPKRMGEAFRHLFGPENGVDLELPSHEHAEPLDLEALCFPFGEQDGVKRPI